MWVEWHDVTCNENFLVVIRNEEALITINSMLILEVWSVTGYLSEKLSISQPVVWILNMCMDTFISDV